MEARLESSGGIVDKEIDELLGRTLVPPHEVLPVFARHLVVHPCRKLPARSVTLSH